MHHAALADARAIGAQHGDERRILVDRLEDPPGFVAMVLKGDRGRNTSLRDPTRRVHGEAVAQLRDGHEPGPAENAGTRTDRLREKKAGAGPGVDFPRARPKLFADAVVREHVPELVHLIVRDGELVAYPHGERGRPLERQLIATLLQPVHAHLPDLLGLPQ